MTRLTKNIKSNAVIEPPELTTPVQRLMDIINNRLTSKISHPANMPESPQDAAKWWITMQEPMFENEKPSLEWTRPKTLSENRRQYWSTPYIDRLCRTLVAFYRLSHEDQLYIIDVQSRNIWWRGDSIEFMKVREKVTPEMAVNREGLLRAMKSMCGHR